jgi:DNA polymerase III subunit delta'
MLHPWLYSNYQTMVKAWEKGVLPHALLVTGLDGVGKYSLADAIARFVLCENKQANQPCGTCRSCLLVAAGSHPDRIELTFEEKSKVIKIAQIRQLSEKLSTKAFSQYQVAIIHPACQMNLAAANALLKTLEEPTAQVLIILVAHDATRLPATISSRCQRLHVSIQDSELALTWLRDTFPGELPERLFRHTQGAPLLAEKLLAQDYFSCRDSLLQALEGAVFQKINPLPLVAEWLSKDQAVLIRILLLLTVDCIKLLSEPSGGRMVNDDCRERIVSLSSQLPLTRWFEFYAQLLTAQATLSTGIAVNVQLMLEGLMLDWCALNRGSLRGSGLC